MRKTVYRYYYGFLAPYQKFLNRMAQKGWRLAGTGVLSYTFEPCQPGEFGYCMDVVAHKS